MTVLSVSKEKILVNVSNYNQSQEIEAFLKDLLVHWPQKNVIVIDDGSNDGSDIIARELGFKVIKHSQNRGVGAALRTGITFAKENGFTHIVMMSSNGKMLCKDIQTVISPILQSSADYVTGSRYLKGGSSPGIPLFRNLSIPLFSLFSLFILGRRFTDITCGFRCYRIDFLDESPINIHQEWLDHYEMEYYIHYWACKKELHIKEVPVTIRYSHLGARRKSKIIPFFGWWSMMRPFVFLKLGLKK